MKFIDLLNLAYNEIDEVDEDEQIEIIVKAGINEAYSILCNKDIRLNRAYVPVINGIAELPEDFLTMVKCIPPITDERVVGKFILSGEEEIEGGTYEVIYAYAREELKNDNDEPDLHITLQFALVQYACYKYFLHRKKVEVAMAFYRNYEAYLFKFESENVGSCKVERIQFVDMME